MYIHRILLRMYDGTFIFQAQYFPNVIRTDRAEINQRLMPLHQRKNQVGC